MKVVNKGNKVIVKPEGKLDISHVKKFKDEVISLINEGKKNICVDLEDVTSIDSTGLGKIILINNKLNEKNGSFKIINIKSDYVSRMFEMVNLDTIIDIEWEEKKEE